MFEQAQDCESEPSSGETDVIKVAEPDLIAQSSIAVAPSALEFVDSFTPTGAGPVLSARGHSMRRRLAIAATGLRSVVGV